MAGMRGAVRHLDTCQRSDGGEEKPYFKNREN